MKVLLAVDGSKHSLRAVNCLIEHAANMLLGSTATKVLHIATLPVLLVR